MRERLQKIIHDILMLMMPQSLSDKSLTCEETTHQLDDYEALSLFGRLRVRMHIFICYKCWNYEEQMQIIKNHFQSHSLEEHNLDMRVQERVIRKHS